MQTLKKILLYIWQLPQNLLGLLVICFTRALHYNSSDTWETSDYSFGVSLGNYIIFGTKVCRVSETSLKHEQGHQKQSLYLGWLYLIIIGLPSITFNIWDIVAHKNWGINKRLDWYYKKLPWERWADKLGKVER